jgi:outer membrane receptor for ferrienterochelin and colicin
MKHTLPFLFFLLVGFQALAQKQFAVAGYVFDHSTNEKMEGVNIVIPSLQKGTVTNSKGYYEIHLTSDSISLSFSHLGYHTLTKQIFIDRNLKLDVGMVRNDSVLQEVIIQGQQTSHNPTKGQISINSIQSKEAQMIPALLGEIDIIKTLQLMPGVQSGGEGSSGLIVRGGNTDQNLITLDETPIYNAGHLFGLLSIFNNDAVTGAQIYKGDFPAQYGGRLSSVIRVKMKEGDKQQYKVNGGLGLITSRLGIEGPIIKDKASFILSGRRTYFDIFTRKINQAYEGKETFLYIPDYYFYDLNAKLSYSPNPNNHLTYTFFKGKDDLLYKDRRYHLRLDWHNTVHSFNWLHYFNSNHYVNLNTSTSQYEYQITHKFDIYHMNLMSGIKDANIKLDFDFIPASRHHIQYGLSLIRHQLAINRLQTDFMSPILPDPPLENSPLAFESGLYFSDFISLTPRLDLQTGIRVSGFHNEGYHYTGFEPRIGLQHKISSQTRLKISFTQMYQYLHLINNSGSSLPTDVWYPANENIHPSRSRQLAAGVNTSFLQGNLHFSNEVYFKTMERLVDFRDGARLFVNPNLYEEVIFGDGKAYGNECFLEKKKGNTTGWISYALSWNWRKFDQINNGHRFPDRNDRRHQLSIVLNQQISPRLSLNTTLIYTSGGPVTLPVSFFMIQDINSSDRRVVPEFTDRNAYRMPAYHRMDIGLIYKLKPKRGEADINFSIYNVYNRRNPFFIYLEESYTNRLVDFKAKQVSLFPIIPSLTYNFRF